MGGGGVASDDSDEEEQKYEFPAEDEVVTALPHGKERAIGQENYLVMWGDTPQRMNGKYVITPGDLNYAIGVLCFWEGAMEPVKAYIVEEAKSGHPPEVEKGSSKVTASYFARALAEYVSRPNKTGGWLARNSTRLERKDGKIRIRGAAGKLRRIG